MRGTETQQTDAAGSVLRGLGSFPNKQGFRVTKALLAEEFDSLTKRLIDAKIKEKIAGGLLNELGGNN